MRRRLAAILLIGAFAALPVAAQEAKEAKTDAPAVDDQKMMEAWMKAATPGAPHKRLEPMIGTFDTKVKSWMAPGAAPVESSGVTENKWALGGRYVMQEYQGSFMGMPFSGIGYTGYDNIRQQYVSLWMDNMSTVPMSCTGKSDGANTMTMTGSVDDPMTGKPMPMREKVTVVDANQHMVEMWSPGPDGKEFKTMEIVYTRKK